MVEAQISAIPPVTEHRAHRIVAIAQEAGHVVGRVLQPAVIRRPAGGELILAHSAAVHVHSVEPEAGDVESRRAHPAVQAELAAQQWRGCGRAVGGNGRRADPFGRPVRRVQQPRLPVCGRAPRRRRARRGPDTHPPVVARGGRRGRHRIGREHRRAGRDPPRVPEQMGAAREIAFVRGNLHLVRRLHRVARGGLEPPTQPRAQRVDPHGVGKVFGAEAGDHHPRRRTNPVRGRRGCRSSGKQQQDRRDRQHGLESFQRSAR